MSWLLAVSALVGLGMGMSGCIGAGVGIDCCMVVGGCSVGAWFGGVMSTCQRQVSDGSQVP